MNQEREVSGEYGIPTDISLYGISEVKHSQKRLPIPIRENGFAEQTTLLRVMDRQSDIMAVRALGVEISRQRRSFSRSPWSFLTGRSSM